MTAATFALPPCLPPQATVSAAASLRRSRFAPLHSAPNPRAAPLRARSPCRARRTLRASSAEVPTNFSVQWYSDSLSPTDLDMAAHYIPSSQSKTAVPTDVHFIDHDRRFMAVLDYPPPPSPPPPPAPWAGPRPAAAACDLALPHAPSSSSSSSSSYAPSSPSSFRVHKQPEPPGAPVLQFIRETVEHNREAALFSNFPTLDLAHILGAAFERFHLPLEFSALLLDVSANILRIASVGTCAVIVVRDDQIVYRSYPYTAAALIDYVSSEGQSEGERASAQRPATAPPPPPSAAATAATTAPSYAPAIHSDFVELQDNDLILAGSDGVFANLTDGQILAFVRPVPDRMDSTLSIANNTCLGAWTSDDVSFISYYLAFLANNFATALNSAPVVRYPFPPSPHLDDVTMLAATFLSYG